MKQIKKIKLGMLGVSAVLGNLILALPAKAQWNTSTLSGFGLPGASIYNIITNILYWLLALFGFISVIGFVIAGIFYLTAAGDETQAERAKKAMTYAIIGVIVGLSGVVVIRAVTQMLSGGMIYLFW